MKYLKLDKSFDQYFRTFHFAANGLMDIAGGLLADCKCPGYTKRRSLPCSQRLELPRVFRGQQKLTERTDYWSYIRYTIFESYPYTVECPMHCCEVGIWVMFPQVSPCFGDLCYFWGLSYLILISFWLMHFNVHIKLRELLTKLSIDMLESSLCIICKQKARPEIRGRVYIIG